MTSSRRTFLAVAPALAFAARGLHAQPAPSAQAVPWSTGTEQPALIAPPGTTYSHHHIFGSRFPLAPGVTSVHPDATAADYMKLAQRLRISRHVAVLPSSYGVDNASLLDALA